MPDPTIRAYLATDEDALVALWTCCGLIRPQNDPHADIARKRAEQPDLLLVADLEGRIIGSVMVGYEPALGFYRALGFAVDEVVSLGKRLVVDAAG